MKPWTKEKLEAIKAATKAAEIKNFIRRKENTPQQIDDLIQYALPIKLGTKRICNDHSHCSPYDFFTDILTNYYQTIVAWANRGGSKTYLLALYSWLKSNRNPGLDSVILGASGEQSSRAYGATNDFWSIGNSDAEITPLIKAFCSGQPMAEKTTYKNGAVTKILTASDRSVRGPHPQVGLFDEIDSMDARILETALSGPQSKGDIKMQKLFVSTNHVIGGNMDEQIELAEKNPEAKIFKWCIWECLESCKDFSCSTCPISSYCPGKQMKKANGYYRFSDFLDKLRSLAAHTIENEWFNAKPGSPDMIYGKQLEDHHFINIDYNPGHVVYLSIDWGGTNPFAVSVWQDMRHTPLNAWVMVDEIYKGNTTNKKIIEIAKQRPWFNMIAGAVYDPSRSDSPREWMEAAKSAISGRGLRLTKADNKVKEGIERVRGALKPVIGGPMFYVSKKCRSFIKEIYQYKANPKTGEPIPVNDHMMDTLKYFVAWKVNPMIEESRSQAIGR